MNAVEYIDMLEAEVVRLRQQVADSQHQQPELRHQQAISSSKQLPAGSGPQTNALSSSKVGPTCIVNVNVLCTTIASSYCQPAVLSFMSGVTHCVLVALTMACCASATAPYHVSIGCRAAETAIFVNSHWC